MVDLERARLNDAIFTVITNAFKKYMQDAVKTVEQAGYKVSKWNGHWHVTNPTTKRQVYCTGDTRRYIHQNGNGKPVGFYPRDEVKVDFVGLLNKPINNEWNSLRWRNWENPVGINKYRDMASRLRDAKWNANYYAGQIKETRRKIEKLQEELEDEVRRAVLAEERLKTVRTELGLSRR